MTDFAIRELFFFKVISHLTMSNEEPYRKNTGSFTRERRCTLYKYKWFQLILVHTVYTFIWCFYKSQKHFHVSRVRIVTPRCFLYIAVQVHVKNHARCPINNKISLFSNVVLDCCNSCFPVFLKRYLKRQHEHKQGISRLNELASLSKEWKFRLAGYPITTENLTSTA